MIKSKKMKDRADRLWVMIHVTALRLTQENRTGRNALMNGGEVQATPLVQKQG